MDNKDYKYGVVQTTPSLELFKMLHPEEKNLVLDKEGKEHLDKIASKQIAEVGAIITRPDNNIISDENILDDIKDGLNKGIYQNASESKQEKEPIVLDIPTWSLPYIINGDADGLSDDEQQMVDDFLDKNFSDGYIPEIIEGTENEFNNSPAFGERNPNALPQYGESPYAATETVSVRFSPFEQSVNIPLANDGQYEYKTVVDNRSAEEKYKDNSRQLSSDLEEVKNRMNEIGGDATKSLKTDENGNRYAKLEVLTHGYPITQGEPNLYVRLDATLSQKTGDIEYNYHSFDEANRDPETGRLSSTKNVISREEWFDRLDGYIQSEGKSYEPIEKESEKSMSDRIFDKIDAMRHGESETEEEGEEEKESMSFRR